MEVRDDSTVNAEVYELIRRSHALGADRRVTNFAGGNTSCKAIAADPLTGEDVQVLWVKGSGGDLGTLTHDGLAALRLDQLLGLRALYRGEEHEDEMVELMEQCRFGPGGAAPSIDTPVHAFLPPAHVDHVHPDAVIALATAADGDSLVEECFEGEVAWIPWRRPGFELALRIEAAFENGNPGVRGMVLGGHGLLAWGDTSEECEATTLELIERAERFLAVEGKPEPFGSVVRDREALPDRERRLRAAALAPLLRGLASTDRWVVGRFSDDPELLDFLARAEAPRLAALGTSCPDHFLRTKVRPLHLDLPPDVLLDRQVARLRELHGEYRDSYAAYYESHADGSAPPMRGADPAIVLLPGIGMWSFGPDAQTARVAGEFYAAAVNAMRGAEAVSRYEPIPESEKFAVEYWWLEEAKLRRRPPMRALAGRVALVTGGGSGIGQAIAARLQAEGAAVAIADLDEARAQKVADELGDPDTAVALRVNVEDEEEVARAFEAVSLAFGGVDLVVQSAGLSISAPLLETTAEDWDRQHRVMARGSFLVSRAAARVMLEQGRGGDLVYVVSKNAVAAGPNNVAYSAAKADQAHQVRLLAVELGSHGIRVNGVNPDGVVQGSGIFAGDWGEQRAAVYGVPREELGRYYASRTLLKKEVLPAHVADAVFALVGGNLTRTTGTIIPVDGGVPAGFMR